MCDPASGYMGGPIVMRTAAAVPDRFAPDAMHGWCPPDSRVYHEAQAEKAWQRLLVLLESSLN